MDADIAERLARAHKLLSSDDARSTAYACLELRQCLEILVYERLQFYKKYAPGVVFEKWQPAQALKMLLQFEPDADSDMRISIARESAPGVIAGPLMALGEVKSCNAKWLARSYNRLGSYLHIQGSARTQRLSGHSQEGLREIASKIAEVANSRIKHFGLAERINFECKVCGTPCFANADAARQSGRALCLNSNCGVEYDVEICEGGARVKPRTAEFPCLNCGASTHIATAKIKIGVSFACATCHLKHVVSQQQWGYELREDGGGGS